MPPRQPTAMRTVLTEVSGEEIRELAQRYGLDVDTAEAASLAAAVTDRLGDGLDDVYEIPVTDGLENGSDRAWEETDDPYNAVAVSCRVPPKPDHTDVLAGRTVGVKDNVAVAGVPMQCSSGVLHGFVPSEDATVAARLREAGGTITAKTNLDEFAGGGRGWSFDGLVGNPRDEERIAGGSSGGSAAAVAADIVDVAVGTDTGGSVRKPAAFCGLVGLKPTYGLVPLTGVVENTYTLDHVGPIARTVEDAARVLSAVAGADRRDPASAAAAGDDAYRVDDYVAAARSPPDPADLRLGVATQGLTDETDDVVAARHRGAVDRLADAGAAVEEVELPHLDVVKHVKNAISYVELAWHWRDGGVPVRRGGGANPFDQLSIRRRFRAGNRELNDFYRSRIFAGAHLMEAHDGRHYARAQAACDVIRADLVETLSGVDAVVTPTVPYLAPELERVASGGLDYDGLGDEGGHGFGRYTKIANVTGVPAVTVPNDVEAGPAVGTQLLGDPFAEADLLGVAGAVADVLDGDG